MLSECIYKVLMASGVVTSSDACDLSGAIEAAVRAELAGQEPVAWVYYQKGVGEKYFTFTNPASLDLGKNAGWIAHIQPLYAAPVVQEKQEPWPFSADRVTYHKAAPVVQPDMVMVPREPTEAMLDAAMNRYKHVSPEAMARYTKMHRENFRCDYKAMIAAAEGKSNAEGKPTPD